MTYPSYSYQYGDGNYVSSYEHEHLGRIYMHKHDTDYVYAARYKKLTDGNPIEAILTQYENALIHALEAHSDVYTPLIKRLFNEIRSESKEEINRIRRRITFSFYSDHSRENGFSEDITQIINKGEASLKMRGNIWDDYIRPTLVAMAGVIVALCTFPMFLIPSQSNEHQQYIGSFFSKPPTTESLIWTEKMTECKSELSTAGLS